MGTCARRLQGGAAHLLQSWKMRLLTPARTLSEHSEACQGTHPDGDPRLSTRLDDLRIPRPRSARFRRRTILLSCRRQIAAVGCDKFPRSKPEALPEQRRPFSVCGTRTVRTLQGAAPDWRRCAG